MCPVRFVTYVPGRSETDPTPFRFASLASFEPGHPFSLPLL
jgi:hypothetical protein